MPPLRSASNEQVVLDRLIFTRDVLCLECKVEALWGNPNVKLSACMLRSISGPGRVFAGQGASSSGHSSHASRLHPSGAQENSRHASRKCFLPLSRHKPDRCEVLFTSVHSAWQCAGRQESETFPVKNLPAPHLNSGTLLCGKCTLLYSRHQESI